MPEKKTAKKKKTIKRTKKTAKIPDIDERIEQFSEEVETLGEKFEKSMENKGNVVSGWFSRTFGILGPLVSSILGIMLLLVITWWVGIANVFFASFFIMNIYSFIFQNVGIFFLLMLFFSYTSYFADAYPRAYKIFSPFSGAVGVTAFFWVIVNLLFITNLSLDIPRIEYLINLIGNNMLGIFWIVLIAGYIIVAVEIATGLDKCCKGVDMREHTKILKNVKEKRLYRSGDEKMLGGVCGGIAEYLGMDPVIIRFLWILISLAYGSGILLYIIMWIIMPRNPNHKWDK